MVKVVVVGGSTTVGSKLVAELGDRGHDAAPVGDGRASGHASDELLAACAGAAALVDVSECTSVVGLDVRADVEAAVRRTLDAAKGAGIGHVVLASTVGVGRLFASEHFLARISAEMLVEASAIPYSIVRTTQLFESIPDLADAATGGTAVRVARVLVEPIAAADVARELASIALGPARNSVTALAGPEPFHLDDLIRWTLRNREDQRAVVTDPHAPFLGAELSDHPLVPAGAARHTTTRFQDWLDDPLRGTRHD